MKRQKLMLLGGIRYLLPVIDAAHKLGAYVITVISLLHPKAIPADFENPIRISDWIRQYKILSQFNFKGVLI